MARIAVIGAGVTGLTAAWELGRAGVDVVVFEAADHIGGKIVSSPVPGIEGDIDAAADAFLARVPDALDVCAELGLDDLVHPAARNAFVYAPTGLHPLPSGQLLGLPTDLDELAANGLVSPAGIERARLDLDADAAPVTDDLSVGALVRNRLGDEILEHLVEPLLAGINAGEADELSVAACAPQIWAVARQGGSLIRAAAAMRARSVDPAAPVFAAPADGMARLIGELARQSGAEIRLGRPVRSVRATGGAVEVDAERFDGVVVATPASATTSLLAEVAPDAADALARIEFASVAMVTAVFDRADIEHDLAGSGLVVARTADVDITAVSWSSSKWAHLDDGRHAVFRISIGHHRDPVDWCACADGELQATAIADAATVMGIDMPEPVGVRVGRWSGAFPQYHPGHLDLVAVVHDAVAAAGPLRVGGASLGGIGVPACIRQGREAARQLLA